MITEADTETCIYCNQARPFTNEHVFPAGMGGDDANYILKGLVCKHCNTDVFSLLEAKLMRQSPFALSRLHMQPEGRNRGNKTKEPEFNHKTCEYIDEEGFSLEAQMVAGWGLKTLPQIQISGDQVRVSGENEVDVEIFFTELQEMLGSSVNVILKTSLEGEAIYEAEEYFWDGHDYQLINSTRQSKAPKGIWLESLTSSKELESNWPRIYKRYRGQINLKVRAAGDAASFLSGVKRTLPTLSISKNQEIKITEQPLVGVGMSIEFEKVMRALAKICVNFACHEYGGGLVRASAFDSIRQCILHGGYDVPVMDVADLNQIFSLDKRSIHLVVLLPMPYNDSVVFMALVRLYGGGVHMMKLAEIGCLTSDLEPAAFEIHYLKNKIERIGYTDYVRYLLSMGREDGLKNRF